MIKMTVIDRNGTRTEISAHAGESLMETLRDAGFAILASCGGCCACATCHCYLEVRPETTLPRAMPEETDLLDTLEYRTGQSRLTCQMTVSDALSGLTVTLAPEE